MPSLSVIVPTLGRPSLRETLISICGQLREEDEVILVVDGAERRADTLKVVHELPVKIMHQIKGFTHGPTNNGGSAQRNFGAKMATGEFLTYMDDDDVWTPGARIAIETTLKLAPTQPHLFRMLYGGQILWQEKEIRLGNVGTGMIVIPNDFTRIGRWTDRYESDYDFIKSWKWDESEIVWAEPIVYSYNGRGIR